MSVDFFKSRRISKRIAGKKLVISIKFYNFTQNKYIKIMKKENENAVEKVSKDVAMQVLSRVQAFTDTGELVLPLDYSPANALKAAMILLKEAKDKNGKPVLEACSKESIATALLKMVVEGMSPLKNQGYFIPYGDQLTWSRSYQGSIALARRVAGVKNVIANVIYEDDVFEYQVNTDTGFKEIVTHEQDMDNIHNDKIKGAYAVISYEDGSKDLEVMTILEIKTAWNQGASKGNSPAHKGFTQEMAKKTVINRACKSPINSSSDSNLFIGGEFEPPSKPESVKSQIEETTATEDVDFTESDDTATDQMANGKEESPY